MRVAEFDILLDLEQFTNEFVFSELSRIWKTTDLENICFDGNYIYINIFLITFRFKCINFTDANGKTVKHSRKGQLEILLYYFVHRNGPSLNVVHCD